LSPRQDYYSRHPETDRDINQEIDRDIQKQQALARYRRLKCLKKFELSLDDQMFLENFEAAMHLMWGFQKLEINTYFDTVSVPTECNKAS
jgi:hypothetical protein